VAEVFAARHAKVDGRVAVRVLPDETAPYASLRARLVREAKALAALSHPKILAIRPLAWPFSRIGETGSQSGGPKRLRLPGAGAAGAEHVCRYFSGAGAGGAAALLAIIHTPPFLTIVLR
jgi:serine/threonine protein kinase